MEITLNSSIVIPICASCKKLRNSKDEWIESASFYEDADINDINSLSHGICPECIKKLYPKFALELSII
jgi:hypothetical protein